MERSLTSEGNCKVTGNLGAVDLEVKKGESAEKTADFVTIREFKLRGSKFKSSISLSCGTLITNLRKSEESDVSGTLRLDQICEISKNLRMEIITKRKFKPRETV